MRAAHSPVAEKLPEAPEMSSLSLPENLVLSRVLCPASFAAVRRRFGAIKMQDRRYFGDSRDVFFFFGDKATKYFFLSFFFVFFLSLNIFTDYLNTWTFFFISTLRSS